MKLLNHTLLKSFALLTVVLSCSATQSWAAVSLKNVVANQSQIDLEFDSKISPKQFKVEYLRDIIQISLQNVSVYPAKIQSLSGMDVTKVFAYQYGPKVVRCRLTVKGKAETYAKRLELVTHGKTLSVKLGPAAADSVAVSQASTARAEGPSAASDPDEAALLERVMNEDPSKLEANKNGADKGAKDSGSKLTGGKPLPSIWKPMGMLFGTLGLFFVALLGWKRLRKVNLQSHRGLSRFLGSVGSLNVLKGKLSNRRKMIEVLASHHLGPKKSIVIVRISGRTMVLGITSESINLISHLSGDAETLDWEEESLLTSGLSGTSALSGARASSQEPALGASAQGAQAVFSDVLGVESSKPSIRAQIKSRMEGLKPL